VLLLADYRCTQLCGSLLGIAAQALGGTGLSPRSDFSFVVVGLNPEAGAGDARAMRDGELAATPELAAEARLLTGKPEDVDRLERALGFTAVRDAGAQRYAHPADLYVLTPQGHVSRVLNGLSADPGTLRLALVEAGQGKIGSLIDRLHVLCYGLDPLKGASSGLAQIMLRVGATGTLLVATGILVAMLRRRGAAGRGT
jgi:protein SCO1/2